MANNITKWKTSLDVLLLGHEEGDGEDEVGD